MHISIHSKNIDVTEGIKKSVDKEFGRIEKLVPECAVLRITVSAVPKRNSHKAEATLLIHSDVVRAECESRNLYDSINEASDILIRRIKKYNEMNRQSSKESIRKVEEASSDDCAPSIVKEKNISLSVNSRAEAVDEMLLLGHSFHLFIDEETNSPAVIYKRADDDFGILVTA